MATTSQIQNSVIELYIAAFNRAPDKAGLDYWVSKITKDNWSINDISKSFFDSQEVSSKYPPSLSDEDFLNTVYNNVLGRDIDEEGLAYWLDQMQKSITRDQMLITIINGAKASSGDANDKLLLQNKTEVGRYFAIDLELNDLDLAKSSLSQVSTLSSSVDQSKDILDIYNYSNNPKISLIVGDDNNNTLNGTTETNYIYALGGDDVITSGDGDNLVVAGSGIDTIYSGSGNDTIKGRVGDDTIYSNDGDDTIYGDEDNDSIHAGNGSDTIYGGDGNDYIYGEDGADTIYGGLGDDSIQGGLGDDVIYGEDGNDIIDAGDGANLIQGGSGDDTLVGGASTDKIYGGSGNDTLYGLDGDDTLDGLIGNDTIFAGSGNDKVNGNEGNDTLYGGSGNDTIDAELGDDTIVGNSGADTLTGGVGSDTFVFTLLDSTITSIDTITDFTYGTDKITLPNRGSEVIQTSKTDTTATKTLIEAANLASLEDGSIDAKIKWFIYDDNTYIVEDLSPDNTFQNETDIIIKLQGNIDLQGLNTSTISFS